MTRIILLLFVCRKKIRRTRIDKSFGAGGLVSPSLATITYSRVTWALLFMEEVALDPHMPIWDFVILCQDTPKLIEYMQNNGLLRKEPFQCCAPMIFAIDARRTDGYRWRCPKCKREKGIRNKSFFTKSRLALKECMMLLYLLSGEISFTGMHYMMEIDKKR